METRKSTTAGVVFWTPAPVRNSPTSSVISEDDWEDEEENEGQAEKDDDFISQMDENGIIGLSEALEGLQLGGTCADAYVDYGPLTPEEADLSGHEGERPPAELSHLSEPPGEDERVLSPCDDSIGNLPVRKVSKKVSQTKGEQELTWLPERHKYIDIKEEVKGGEEAVKRSGWMSKKSEHLLAMELPGVSHQHWPTSQSASPITAPTFPLHLLHFTAEEIAASPGIETETFPEISCSESPPESYRSQVSLRSSPRPEITPRASLQPAARFPEKAVSHQYSGGSKVKGPLQESLVSDKHHERPTPSPRRTRQQPPEAVHSRTRSLSAVAADSLKCKHQPTSPDREPRIPRARSNAAEEDESKKGPLSYRTPDFSKVEPRVRFPKGGYQPPKSRRSFNRDSLSPEPPLVFKSPADIVKEVLLNVPDGFPAPSDSYRPPTSDPDFTVPLDFRCRQQATTLLEQLQEDYNTLLTKYAEAENTIDRLRLEAKVKLYSDPAKPGLSVQSGLNREPSRLVMLDFPQAQRADISPASPHPNGQSTHQRSSPAGPSPRSPGLNVAQQLAKILYSQADKFLQQLQTFEDLLKSRKLSPVEQMKGLPPLAEGLDSLERGYLLARDEHKLLQQRGVENSHFDPERELEGLIFQCGLCMDELKEQVEQARREQPTCEAPPSPPPHPTSSSLLPEGGENLTHPQSPPEPLLVDPGEAAAVEVSSASAETDDEQEDEETLTSLYLKPLSDKHRRVEEDFAELTDHYQSFKELPKLVDHSQRDGAPLPAPSRTNMHPGDEERGGPSPGAGILDTQRSLPKGPSSRRASSLFTTLPVHPPRRRLEVGKSHSSSLSSLGEITASERKNSKVQTGSSRVLSQDRIISPETDSGFVGSESSRLTPAAAPSPLHQRASESISVLQDGHPGKPQTGTVSGPSHASSPSHICTPAKPKENSRLSLDQPRRSRQGRRRRSFSCSPQRWFSQEEQNRANSGTIESGLDSDCNGQNGQYTESSNSLYSSSSSSSPAVRHRHGNSLQAVSSSQAANRNDAIQKLQAEVTSLKERLERCQRNKKPPGSFSAAPSAEEEYTHYTSTPRIRPVTRVDEQSRGRRRDGQILDESSLRQIGRKRPPSAHRQKPQPDISSEPSTSQPQPLVSRWTQTSAATDSCSSHTNTAHRTHPRRHPAVSLQVRETADEPDSRRQQAALCPECLSRRQGRPEGPVGGTRETTRHCPICGCPELHKGPQPDCHRVSHSATQTSCRPAESLDAEVRGRHFTAAAPQYCVPVCPPPLLLYPSPLYVSSGSNAGTRSGVRGRRETRGRTARSLSADRQDSVDSSLDRAIRAARHMKHTTGHMVRSLASGLRYQEVLSQSCS